MHFRRSSSRNFYDVPQQHVAIVAPRNVYDEDCRKHIAALLQIVRQARARLRMPAHAVDHDQEGSEFQTGDGRRRSAIAARSPRLPSHSICKRAPFPDLHQSLQMMSTTLPRTVRLVSQPSLSQFRLVECARIMLTTKASSRRAGLE